MTTYAKIKEAVTRLERTGRNVILDFGASPAPLLSTDGYETFAPVLASLFIIPLDEVLSFAAEQFDRDCLLPSGDEDGYWERYRLRFPQLREVPLTFLTAMKRNLQPSIEGVSFVLAAVSTGIPLAIATNNVDWLLTYQLSDLTGLRNAIPQSRRICSTNARCRKRDPKFWDYLKRALPDFCPGATLFVDDRQNNLDTAAAAGFKTLPRFTNWNETLEAMITL